MSVWTDRHLAGRLWALGLLLALLAALAPGQESPDQLYSRAIQSIATVHADMGDGTEKIGTAFLALRKGIAVTALHVVKGAVSVELRFKDGQKIAVTAIQAEDGTRDIACLAIPTVDRPVLAIYRSDPEIGKKIYVIGAPEGLDFSLSDGLVSQVRLMDGVKYIQISAPVNPGNSGGPVFTDDGRVVGIISFRYVDSQGLNFAVKASYLDSMAIGGGARDESPAERGGRVSAWLGFKPTVGATFKFTMSGSFQTAGGTVTLTGHSQDRVVRVDNNGSYTVSTRQDGIVLEMNGQRIPAGTQTTTAHLTRSGRLFDMTADHLDSDTWRASLLNDFVYPNKTVKAGDSWSVSIPADERKGSVPISGKFTVLGFERLSGHDTVKVSSSLKETSGQNPATEQTNVWIDLADGYVLKSVSTFHNLPIAGGQADGTLSYERE